MLYNSNTNQAIHLQAVVIKRKDNDTGAISYFKYARGSDWHSSFLDGEQFFDFNYAEYTMKKLLNAEHCEPTFSLELVPVSVLKKKEQ